MSISALTRRAAIRSLSAFAGLSIGAIRPALAEPAIRFRDVRVDVAPLRASAGEPTAEWVERELPGDLAKAMGAYISPGARDGATLVARVQLIYLGPTGGAGPSGASQDSIQGVLIVKGSRDGLTAETPLRAISTYYPMGVDQALVEEAYHGRVVALAQAFAGWAPRELGL
jgi:hypothetical protein